MSANQPTLNTYKERRLMPRVLIPDRTFANRKNSFLVSGNLDYFVRYGLSLIDSHVKNGQGTGLIINCVDFTMQTAQDLLGKYFHVDSLGSIFLTKTEIPLSSISPERKLSYLKTIRYYVALQLRLKTDLNLIVGDIDALITRNDFGIRYDQLISNSTTFGVGSTYDYLGEGLFRAASINYLWRTVKAGFTFFKSGDSGLLAIKRIVQSLFNYQDDIPPSDELKLYRAYYGDQLAILLTSLELNSASKKENHKVKCIGCSKNSIVTFGKDPNEGTLWIPPASQRNNDLFSLGKLKTIK